VTATASFDSTATQSHLVARGLVTPGTPLAIRSLSGGVSCDVFEVMGPGVALVVKRPLSRLRVAHQWLANETRIITESRALELVHSMTPGVVPLVVDLDEGRRILVIERAPLNWHDWRSLLLEGELDDEVARGLGRALASWHLTTSRSRDRLGYFSDVSTFIDLRINPFYKTIASQHPALRDQIDKAAEALLTTKVCLVHGDFSPKNVLTGDGRIWVIDWEVAHIGDPSFDLAFLLVHLLLKATHRMQSAFQYRRLARLFLEEYERVAGARVGCRSSVRINVGCLLLARVDGKSPATYLTPSDQVRARALATAALNDPPAHVLELWDRL
jgi:5-methylthioribose kinase